MKQKNIVLVFVLILAVALIGCNMEVSPEEVVKDAFFELKNSNLDSFSSYLTDEDNFNDNKDLFNFELFVENLDIEVNSSTIDGNLAKINTTISNTNFQVVLQETFAYVIPIVFENAFSEDTLSEEDMNLLLEDTMREMIFSDEVEIVSTKVDIILLQEEGTWKIEYTDDLQNAIFYGLSNFYDDISEAFEQDLSYSDDVSMSNNYSSSITINPKVIFEKNDIVITVTGLNMKGFLGPEILVLIENYSDKNITVQIRNSTVNDFMIDTLFSCDVAAYKKANDTITLASSDLEMAKIGLINEIEFSFHIFDSSTWEDIIDSDIITLHTTADAAPNQNNSFSGLLAYEGNDLRVIVMGLDIEDSFWGADLYLYIENISEKNLTIQARDVSINGFMVDPIFSSDVLSNKKIIDTISFMESDMTSNSITDIEEVELKLHIIDLDSWDTVEDTDSIAISFIEEEQNEDIPALSFISNLYTASSINAYNYEPTNILNTFSNDTPEIFATFEVDGLPIGTDIQGEWVYEGEQVAVAELYTTEESQNAYFSFTIPDSGWPSGSYEINIYIQEEFSIGKSFNVN
jgi:hypothetical protein